MPEQISKYPEVTLKVLKGAGARCGVGAEQKILKKCPAERFCALATGEICVYGINEIPQMTQITSEELARVACPPRQSSSASAAPASLDPTALAAILLVGLMLGRRRKKVLQG